MSVGGISANVRVGGLWLYNKAKRTFDWWEAQDIGATMLPDYIKLNAEGKAQIVDGRVYILKPKD